MSFSLNRSGKNIIRKSLIINSQPNVNNIPSNVGSTSNTSIANINTLSINNIPITASANSINNIIVTPGVAEPSKLLVLDSNRDIANLNRIDCSNLIVNGETISLNTFQSNGTNDLYNSDIINNQYGIATANKALLLDSKNNIQKLNQLSLTSITYKDNNIISNDIYHSIKLKTFNDITPTIQTDNSRYKFISGSNFTISLSGSSTFDTLSRFQNYNWSGIAWSPELSLFVAVCKDTTTGFTTQPGNYRVIISNNGNNWTFIDIGFDVSLNNIIWISKLHLFVIISNSNVYTSPNGINWTARSIPLSNNLSWSNLCWSNELNMCVITNTSNGILLYSYDCITWYSSITNENIRGLGKIVWSPELHLFIALTNTSNENGFILSSNGINWTPIPSPNGASSNWNDIAWSPYLNMFVAVTSSPTNKYMSYSYDGYNWFYGYNATNTALNTIIWADELKLWIGYTQPSNGRLATSVDGKSWIHSTNHSTFSGSITSFVWSPELAIFVASFSHTVSGTRILTIEPTIISKKPNLLINKSYLTQNLNTNYSGILTESPTAPLEINSTSGNILKLYNSNFTNSITLSVDSNGKLDITSTNLINLSSNFTSFGLQLNNVLITTSPSNLNLYLSNNVSGTALANKPIILDNNLNIVGLNNISCTQLNVNNIPYTINNSSYFSNPLIGNIVPQMASISDINNNILGFNNISLSNYKLANHEISAESNMTINYNAYKTNTKIDTLQTIISQTTSNFVTLSTFSGAWSDIIWSSKLQLYVGVCSMATGTLSTSRFGVSTNGINWTILTAANTINTSFSSITYSDELSMFVALSNGSNNAILTSPDGYNWYNKYYINSSTSTSWRNIVWAKELSLFVAVGFINSSTLNIVTSTNGNSWDMVYSMTSVSSPFAASLVWNPQLSLFVISCSHTSTPILYSTNGYSWSIANISIPTSRPSSNQVLYKTLIWSYKLNMYLCFTTLFSNYYLYSYNGIDWYSANTPNSTTIENGKWINDLDIFLLISSSGFIFYSKDGFIWNSISIPSNKHIFEWSSDLQQLILLSSSTAAGSLIHYSLPYKKFQKKNTLVSQNQNIKVNQQNGYMGISSLYSAQLNPTFQLQLSNDSAGKPGSSTWTVSSDSRLKENIEDANLETCYNNFKNLQLVHYKWKDSDLTQLGWIAQDVENIYPKSISVTNYKNIEDCKFLNNDQINATLYGTLQYMINNIEEDSLELDDITNELNIIETKLNTLITE